MSVRVTFIFRTRLELTSFRVSRHQPINLAIDLFKELEVEERASTTTSLTKSKTSSDDSR